VFNGNGKTFTNLGEFIWNKIGLFCPKTLQSTNNENINSKIVRSCGFVFDKTKTLLWKHKLYDMFELNFPTAKHEE